MKLFFGLAFWWLRSRCWLSKISDKFTVAMPLVSLNSHGITLLTLFECFFWKLVLGRICLFEACLCLDLKLIFTFEKVFQSVPRRMF